MVCGLNLLHALKGLKSLNIEHPMVTQINSFGYPKDYWKDEAERNGYEDEDDEDNEDK